MSVEIQDTAGQIYHAAIRFLSYREHSVEELRVKLQKNADSASEVAHVLDQLLADDLLSDYRYAEAYTRARVRKGYGSVHIHHQLLSRGVNQNIAMKALTGCGVNWSEEIYQVWCKKFNDMPQAFSEHKAKQWRFLQYRGFTQEQIKDLFARLNT